MILQRKPLTLAEVKVYAKNLDENKILDDYLKQFLKLSKDKSEKLAEEINSLNNPKVKEENIVNIVDFLPKDSEDLSKIFNTVSLTEEESNSILSIVKKYES